MAAHVVILVLLTAAGVSQTPFPETLLISSDSCNDICAPAPWLASADSALSLAAAARRLSEINNPRFLHQAPHGLQHRESLRCRLAGVLKSAQSC